MTPARRAILIQDHFARCPGKGGMVHLIHDGGRLALFAVVVTARNHAPVQRYHSEISVVELRNVRDYQSKPGDVAILGYTCLTHTDSNGVLHDFTAVSHCPPCAVLPSTAVRTSTREPPLPPHSPPSSIVGIGFRSPQCGVTLTSASSLSLSSRLACPGRTLLRSSVSGLHSW